MKTYSILFSNESDLIGFIDKNKFGTHKNLLVQVFSGVYETRKIHAALTVIKRALPQAHIIGATSVGGIIDGHSTEESLVLVFTLFENTTLRSIHFDLTNYDAISAKDWAPILSTTTKAVIVFSSGLNLNHGQLLDGLATKSNTVTVAGGIAGNTKNMDVTRVFHATAIIKLGVVAVSLSSDHLFVKGMMKFNWEPLGIPHTITRAEDNMVHEIDGMSVVKLYEKYLGTSVSLNLNAPGTASFFPLVNEKNGILNSNALLKTTDEGSGVFAGSPSVGDKVQLAYADSEMLLDNTIVKSIEEETPETMFIYSCGGRKGILDTQVDKETIPLAAIAPTNGFFTFGEFFTAPNGTYNILNNTMTILLLSERVGKRSFKIHKGRKEEHSKPMEKGNTPISNTAELKSALRHFIQVVTHELAEANAEMQHRNEELNIAKQLAENAVEVKDKFFFLISHDLRSAIIQISYLVEMMHMTDMKTDPNQFFHYLNMIGGQSKTMLETFDSLFLWAKNQINELNVVLKKQQVNKAITHNIELLGVAMENKKITLVNNIPDELEATFDLNMLSIVFRNLIDNAIKFTQENGQITLNAKSKGDYLIFSVKDTGMGIPQSKIASVFSDITFKATRDTQKRRGLGLGLKLCKDFIEKLNGVIWVESESGKGSTFSFSLPNNV